MSERNDSYKENLMSGKVCFMSGATSGINRQIAVRFAMEGAKVFVISRSQDKVDDTVAELHGLGAEAAGAAVDVRNWDAVEAAVKTCVGTFGEIDMVLAGQAGNFPAGAAQMSANAFKSVVDIDLLGSFNIFRATVHHVKKPGASLIAITAPQATHPWLYQSHVCAAKAGVNMLVKCLAMEWGASGIRVNAISPGPIADTEGMRRLAGTPEAAEKYKSALALKDFGSKDNIADAALWLCSSAASYVTGTILEVEGGTSLGDASGSMKL
ncbi:SDR family oxidoreductase [Parvularcula flava]|uniref:SDR family oxidoreductase n=1 Tax=Aquisalinus luteolus TaxID=1566827 RepID=A0A8J3A1S6_9PROT|nr:SDR family oxidoreductase [Aquisalinus luteolus]NHK27675.1 SDR family oxidoreductase [Aquisalinus luteolus]GGH96158.1 short-chain dehydrogenase [Aquisalinus luteolus]